MPIGSQRLGRGKPAVEKENTGDVDGRLSVERRKVLLVDDSAPLRRNLARAFERDGFKVATASSLNEAYHVAAEFCPDFALLDLHLQDGYGMKLVTALQDLRPGVRIVILTGYDSIASSIVALKAGVIGYLAKPAQTEMVMATLLGRASDTAASPWRPMSANRLRWEHIQRVYEQCNRNTSETARRLNMHRRTLHRILNKRAPRE